ncbi:glycoside hydrolase family 88 protein [Niabella hibiscisoli]|uniref:glycoside hydrolase family 88 protein n=1 Tax=Niabella hibiscisoli TaxID=1825928 RepID=UPI0021D432B2|nr:glycoside hydrolase family 88 protein [Niabella hibiscisoli]
MKIACLLVSLLLSVFMQAQKPWSQKMVESHGVVDFYCNTHYQAVLGTTGWDYVSGLVANAVMKAWEAYPEKAAYYNAVKAFADNSLSEDGSFIKDTEGKSALRPSNIDDYPAGRIYFALYKEELRKGNTKDANRYKTAATLIRNTLKYHHSRIAPGLPGEGGFFTRLFTPIRCGWMVYTWALLFMLNGNIILAIVLHQLISSKAGMI